MIVFKIKDLKNSVNSLSQNKSLGYQTLKKMSKGC